jgi:hypothetical protein
MQIIPTSLPALGLEPTYSAREASAMLGRSYSWLDQNLRAGKFVEPDGAVIQALRTRSGYRRFPLQTLRDIIVASYRNGWFSTHETKCALHAVIAVKYQETGAFVTSQRTPA